MIYTITGTIMSAEADSPQQARAIVTALLRELYKEQKITGFNTILSRVTVEQS